MKTNFVKLFFFLGVLFLTACAKPIKTEILINPPDQFSNGMLERIQDLNEIIYPLDGASPSLGQTDLAPLSVLGGTKIIGLGEATHGTREFFQIKHRVFKYLVENCNVRILGFEMDLGESIYFDRYICEGEGDLDDLMINTMSYWTWRTKEVKDLLAWMKSYNDGKTDEEKIHILGFDNQYLKCQPDLIMDYVNNVKPDFVDKIQPTMNIFYNMNNSSYADVSDYYSNMSENEKNEISDSLNLVLDRFEAVKSELIANSSAFEYHLIKRLVVTMLQTHTRLYGWANDDVSFYYRDLYMAENVLWQSDLLGDNVNIALWAHNGHVANDMNYTETGSMGFLLKNELGDQYQILGFSFSMGAFRAVTRMDNDVLGAIEQQLINVDPLENSLNQLFHYAQYDNFILRTGDIQINSELGEWSAEARPMLLIGAAYNNLPEDFYRPVLLRDYYDIIIHYDYTTAAQELTL